MLGAATHETRALTKLAVEAVFKEAIIDGQIERGPKGYGVVVRLVRAEQVLHEVELLVVWNDLDEVLKLAVLGLYVRGVLLGAERWKRRSDRAVERALHEARVRVGLQD